MERRLFVTRKTSWRMHLIGVAALLLALSLILSACGAQSTPTTQAQVSAATPTQANPTATAPPTATPVPPTPTPAPTDTPTAEPSDTPAPPTPEPAAAEDGPSFSTEVQPVFDERCIQCHSGNSAPRGLSLDSYEHILAGGTYRPVIAPGLAEESELVKRVKGEAIPRMPFDGPPFLSDEQIALIVDWIEAGAPNN